MSQKYRQRRRRAQELPIRTKSARPVIIRFVIAVLVVALGVGGFCYQKYRQDQFFLNIADEDPFLPDYPLTRDYATKADFERKLPPIAMSSQELSDYFMVNVRSVLEKAKEDPDELPFVRERLSRLLDADDRGEIGLRIAFEPALGHEGAIASSTVEEGKRFVVFIGPAVRSSKERIKPSAFKDQMILTAVHEVLHETSFLRAKHSRRERVEEEAAVWAKMITNVVRPWYVNGRHVGSNVWKIAKYFDECGNDPKSPKWLKFHNFFLEGN